MRYIDQNIYNCTHRILVPGYVHIYTLYSKPIPEESFQKYYKLIMLEKENFDNFQINSI